MSTFARLRAVAVVALSWGVLWSMVGAALGFNGMRQGATFGYVKTYVGFMGPCGILCGAVFAAILSRRRVSGGKMPSVARSAILGAVGAGSVAIIYVLLAGPPLITPRDTWHAVRFVGIVVGLGGLSAATLVGMARRAPEDRDRT